ncbi:MAG: sensor histidine kinase KdpD [Planctomycetes bacterium]|nr:sensor histidine kinase KdpD [Planctomycetota bacterium]
MVDESQDAHRVDATRDLVLDRVKAEAVREPIGRFKVFLGAAPGVGKTFAMLAAARRAVAAGKDVVAGIIETHGRAETRSQLEGLELLPRRVVEHRGHVLEEFDLDRALKRRPRIVLVDELAHTNEPHARHPKRWQDVFELLAEGIDVWTTLNVQHVESLNDVVTQITGVRVRETLPDYVLQRADEVELVDLPPDALLARLREGRVYPAEQAARAEANFFKRGNLLALRELALRRTAEHVDVDVREWRRDQGIERTWPAAEHVLVGVRGSASAKDLVRAGARLASGLKARFTVAHVELHGSVLSARDRARLSDHLRLAERLGAEVVALSGNDVAAAMLEYARAENVTRLVVGKPMHARWRDVVVGSLLDRIVRGSGAIDVLVIAGDPDADDRRRRPRSVRGPRRRAWPWLAATLVVAVTTAVNQIARTILDRSDLAMLYVVAIVLVALRFGRAPAVFASVLSVLAFDFFFVPPYFTFAVGDVKYLVTFAVMLVVGLVVSGLTESVRAQAEAARSRERRTAALFSLTRELAEAPDAAAITEVAARHLAAAFDCRVCVLLADASRHLVGTSHPHAFELDERDLSVAAWVFDLEQRAGIGSDTLPGARALFLPLLSAARAVGVLALLPAERSRFEDVEAEKLLDAFVHPIATALGRAALAGDAAAAKLRAEREELRNALLSSVSHDLRTPLAAITGAATSLVDGASLSDAARADLMALILEEAQRLNRLVGNLLQMTKIESGTLELRSEWSSLEEVIGCALARFERFAGGVAVKVELADALPLVPMDVVLIEQVLTNLLENAARHGASAAPIEIGAWRDGDRVVVEVRDRGPGISAELAARVFDKFVRGPATSAGSGLGLTICRGIVAAHGGKIEALPRTGGGAILRFSLPLPELAPRAMPASESGAQEPSS